MALGSAAIVAAALSGTFAACGDDGGGSGTPDAAPADAATADAGEPEVDAMPAPTPTYAFESRFIAGESPVSYSGQTMRHVLIAELITYLGGLTDAVETTPPVDDAVLGELLFYFDFDSNESGQASLNIDTTPALAQSVFDDISTDKQLRDKTAGNDASTDHKEWNTPGNFQGWSEGGDATDTPTELIEYWFGQLDDLAFERGQGNVAVSPDVPVYVTAAGQDLSQLLEKFLLSAVAFAQGTDDYFDDATPDKGLLSSNTQEEGQPYSTLGHAWDEGFGYFGAARNYDQYSDEELSGGGGRAEYQSYQDFDGDDKIDVLSEYNFGASVNCAKRDVGSVSPKTDYTKTAFDALVAGRQLIVDTDGELDAAALETLKGHRDAVVSTWERCLAATVVHYINDTLADMGAFGGADYSFEDHAKHWSELKGFALGLQFNPRSPMLEGTRFTDFHDLIRDAPVLADDPGGQDEIDQYTADLEAARDLIQEAYGFSDENVAAW
ncbi:MAG: hypothetical protein Tsb0020_38080 [Haliangiales bacterium]